MGGGVRRGACEGAAADGWWCAQGCRGFAEWAFMSTTADKSVAVQYSGVMEGRPKAMVLVITVSAVDRGACIRDLSQVFMRE